jgi:hypothetical protein
MSQPAEPLVLDGAPTLLKLMLNCGSDKGGPILAERF